MPTDVTCPSCGASGTVTRSGIGWHAGSSGKCKAPAGTNGKHSPLLVANCPEMARAVEQSQQRDGRGTPRRGGARNR